MNNLVGNPQQYFSKTLTTNEVNNVTVKETTYVVIWSFLATVILKLYCNTCSNYVAHNECWNLVYNHYYAG